MQTTFSEKVTFGHFFFIIIIIIENNSQLPVHHKVSHGAYKRKYKNPIHLKHIQTYIKHKIIKGTKPKKHKK